VSSGFRFATGEPFREYNDTVQIPFEAAKTTRRQAQVKPIGPMMREHRLIERMLALLELELSAIATSQKADPVFIETAIDFFKTYADRTHHGKEEEFNFRDLTRKSIATEHRRILEELVEEHIFARAEVRALLNASERYAVGESEALDELTAHLTTLVGFYPGHIEKEDKHFFFPTQKYFSKEEQDDMLREFEEFDARMIHEKYSGVVERFEKE
jgi:hemerythrin-like domain-containing protein